MISAELYSRYLRALLQGDTRHCTTIVTRLLESDLQITSLYTELLQKSLYQVGELWEKNNISVAVEHLATAITERLLVSVYPTLLAGVKANGRKALISCSVNEYHQIGARMVADIMETRGWDVCFLGANTPAEDMLRMIEQRAPEILGLSVSIYLNMAPLQRMIEMVRSSYPGLDIFVGGQGFRWGGTGITKKFTNIEYVASLQSLETILGVK